MSQIKEEDGSMKFSLKTYIIDHFIAPAIAVFLLGSFGAVCVGLIHRFSYGLMLFFPLIGAIILMLFLISITRAAWIIIKTRKGL